MHKPYILFLLIFLSSNIYSQTQKNIFIGIQPGVTVEPFYEKGELDINILPVVFETRIGDRTNLRFLPLVNLHSGGTENGISDVGLFTVLPIFLNDVERMEDHTFGFYVGPVLGLGRNLLNDHYTSTLAVEPGYMFESEKSFTITMGMQLGASHFFYDSAPNEWTFHWGPKVTFGYWLKKY